MNSCVSRLPDKTRGIKTIMSDVLRMDSSVAILVPRSSDMLRSLMERCVIRAPRCTGDNMDLSQKKEQFSEAWLRAVAAAAGFAVAKPTVDNDSIDLTVSKRGGKGTVRSPKLDVQLKCTATEIIKETDLRFPLEKKNYDELRYDNFAVPRILVVLCVPAEPKDWLQLVEESHLLLKQCAYWTSLRGKPESPNETTVIVSLLRTQRLDDASLLSIMERIEQGGIP